MASLRQKWEKTSAAPYVFPGDEVLLEENEKTARLVCKDQTFAEWVSQPEFGNAEDNRFHLDLLPTPFWGNLEKSSVFLLMLNPGLSPSAFWSEENVKQVRQEKLKNLRQDNGQDEYPFSPLNPQFSWYPAANYWRKKFNGISLTLQKEHNYTYQEAAQLLSKNVSCLQLVPYQSKNFKLPSSLAQQLESVLKESNKSDLVLCLNIMRRI